MGKTAGKGNAGQKEKLRIAEEKARLKEQNKALKAAARNKAETVKKDVSKKAPSEWLASPA